LARFLPLAYIGVVAAVALDRAVSGHPSVSSLALTPDRLAAGQVWLLATSAVIINGTALPQLVALAVTMFAALRALGAAFVVLVMVVAHVGATLLAYAILLVTTGDADGAHNLNLDYGTSAVWLGLLGALAVAYFAPARRGDRGAQLVVAAACVSAIVGAALFPLMPALEHALAFALGAGLAALRGSRRFAGRSARSAASTASGRAAAA
jgi:hypothetical protein